MPVTESLKVADLQLDLENFRTIPQDSEAAAVAAMVSTSPDRFWALVDSLIADGYLPTENILVLKGNNQTFTVKEGNRRVAALKLVFGLVDASSFHIPVDLSRRIQELEKDWFELNRKVPCAVYSQEDRATVDRIVTLAHGKGEKAGRDQWNAVARARHNRKEKGASEPALDLLEKYLEHGKNVTQQQGARWAGDYPVTVLEEAMKRLAPRLGVKNARALADVYPGSIAHRKPLEEILKAIGLGRIGFDAIRSAGDDFGMDFGFPGTEPPDPAIGAAEEKAKPPIAEKSPAKKPATSKTKASRVDDPKTVKAILKRFSPQGLDREKVVQLRDEAININIKRNPLAFCFLLRSMFEISGKAYCADHAKIGGPTSKKHGGQEKTLVELLRDVTKHMTSGNADKQKLKELHGALTELAKPEGLLSVTSMNQLVHNPKFVVTGPEVSVLFGRIFPLLEDMNN